MANAGDYWWMFSLESRIRHDGVSGDCSTASQTRFGQTRKLMDSMREMKKRGGAGAERISQTVGDAPGAVAPGTPIDQGSTATAAVSRAAIHAARFVRGRGRYFQETHPGISRSVATVERFLSGSARAVYLQAAP
jgi:hypothetical protein